MEVMPNLGWSNAVPDAVADVNLVVNGTEVRFEGVGNHCREILLSSHFS